MLEKLQIGDCHKRWSYARTLKHSMLDYARNIQQRRHFRLDTDTPITICVWYIPYIYCIRSTTHLPAFVRCRAYMYVRPAVNDAAGQHVHQCADPCGENYA
ncbi:unnamed protein product [Sphacelaria rigidula]